MVKKIIIGSAVVLGIAFLVAGPGIFSHVGHVFHKARSSIQDALPLEYELERAEGMIEKITPEIEEGRKIVAQEQVEARYLGNEIAALEARQVTTSSMNKPYAQRLVSDLVEVLEPVTALSGIAEGQEENHILRGLVKPG